MNISISRFCALLFVACFLGLQLCQVNHVEPIKQDTDTFYEIGSFEVDSISADLSSPFYLKAPSQLHKQQVSQKLPVTQQKQCSERIDKRIQPYFVYPKLQHVELDLVEQRLQVSFTAQQQLQLSIQPIPRTTYRLLKPDLEPDLSYFSLS